VGVSAGDRGSRGSSAGPPGSPCTGWRGLPTRDPTNSFKAYRRDFLERTPIESAAGFSLGLELTVKAHFAGERVEEIPATWRDRTAGESRFRLMAWLPLYLRWYFWALRKRWLG
jgi:hypothetical protein